MFQQCVDYSSDLKSLQLREFAWKQPKQLYHHFGFSKSHLQNFMKSKANIKHDGCINAAKWTDSGEFLLTGSDDRTIKIWQLSGSVDNVLLRHTIQTHHRGNIFSLDISREDPSLIVSAAADGTVRTNYIDRPNAGTTLHTSDNIIHMVQFDYQEPNILYTAEQSGEVYRIDLRTNQKEIVFQHTVKVYENCPAYQSSSVSAIVPKWTGKGAVKAITQNSMLSTPHLVLGGKGYMVGLIDLRSSSRIPANDGAIVNPFLKLWSPLFPMELDDPDKIELHERYRKLSTLHPFSRKAVSSPKPPSSPISPKFSNTQIVAGDNVTEAIGDSEYEVDEDEEDDDDETNDDEDEDDEDDEDESEDEETEQSQEEEDNTVEAEIDSVATPQEINTIFGPINPLNQVSISGLKISKDGRRILANFQNDQIYTFNFNAKDTVMGVEGIIGGHINHDTFLKTVDFFGPRDEYVVAGSDSGHLWIWESNSITTSCHEFNVDMKSTCCRNICVLRADNRTCNGAVPHPQIPIIVTYGIDSDAKLFSCRTPDDQVEENSNYLGMKDSDLATMSPKIKKDQYELCAHDGSKDSERYHRISLPLRAYPKDQIIKRSMYNFPSLIERNKAIAKCMFPEAYQPDFPHMPLVVRPFDFIDTSFHVRLNFMRDHVMGFGESRALLSSQLRQYFDDDLSPYMPSDAMYYILQQGKFFNEEETIKFANKLLHGDKLNSIASETEKDKLLSVFCNIFNARGNFNRVHGRDFLQGLIHSKMNKRKKRLFNYFFMPVMELMRFSEISKTIGNNAFRAKDLDYAHFFYCKAQRYLRHILDFKLISPTIVKKKREQGNGSQFQETYEFSDGASVSMHVAVDPRGIGPIPEEIHRVARDAILNSDAPLSTLTNALEAMSESGIGRNLVARTLSKQNEPSTADDEIDSIDDEELRKEFPDELFPVSDPKPAVAADEKLQEQNEIHSPPIEQPLESSQSSSEIEEQLPEMQVEDATGSSVIATEGSERSAEKEEEGNKSPQDHSTVAETKFAWKATRIEQIVEKIIEILYADLIPETMQTILSNLAATFIAMEKYNDAVNVCNDAFQIAKVNKLKPDAKLLFRRGSANINLHNYEEAITDLQQALNLCPKDNAINNKLKEAKRLSDAKRKREMKAYSKMFEA